MTSIERRILINQRTIMQALYIIIEHGRLGGTSQIYAELNEDSHATLKLLKENKEPPK